MSLLLISFIYSITTIYSVYSEKILTSSYKQLGESYSFLFDFDLDDELLFSLPIDLSAQYTVLTGVTVNNEEITNDKSSIMSEKGSVVSAKEIKKKISFSPNTIIDFNFFLLMDDRYSRLFPKALAFPYKTDNEKFAFVYQLHSAGLIENKIFTFEPPATVQNGNLYFGGIPDVAILNRPYILKCKVNDNYKQWGCDIDAVYISQGGKILNYTMNTQYALFNTNCNYIDVPISFKNFLVDTIFDKYIKSKNCELKNRDIYQYTGFLSCDCQVIYGLPDLSFVFGKKVIKFKIENLFEIFEGSIIDGEYCILTMRVNYDTDEWKIGTKFFNDLMISFDYNKGMISFYSDKPYDDNLLNQMENSKPEVKIIYSFVSLINIVSILYIMWYKYII